MTAHDDDDDVPIDLAAWTAPPPPDGLADRVLAAVHSATPVEAERSRPRRGLVVGGAIAAVLAVAASVALWPHERATPRAGHIEATAPAVVTLAGDVEATVEAGAQLIWQHERGGLTVHHAAGVATYRHRGDGRLEVVTPVGALASERATFRVEAPMMRNVIVGGSAAAVAAVVVVAVYQGRVQARSPETPAPPPVAIEAGQELALRADRGPAPAPVPAPVAVAKAAVDRARRDALAKAIAAVRQPAAPSPGGGATVVGSAPRTTLGRDEIRTSVREVVPMIAECYELELDRDPQVGKTTVKARLIVDSEPDLGTVVAVSDLEIPGALGTSTDFRDCLTATLEAMVLPPLEEGAHVEINYPFIFSPAPPDGDDTAAAPPSAPAPTATATPAAKPSKPAPAPSKPAPTGTVEENVSNAGAAAMNGTWARARQLAENALALGAAGQMRTKAINIAALAACNLRDVKSARRYYQLAPDSMKTAIRQQCLRAGGFDPAS